MEIFYNGEWGTVCDDFWDLKDAIVVCRQLGYTTAARRTIEAEFGEGTGTIWLDNIHCSGTESKLSECNANTFGNTNCYHRQDAGVVCASKCSYKYCFHARCMWKVAWIFAAAISTPLTPLLRLPGIVFPELYNHICHATK